jgi:hypothetical protein
MPVRWKKRLRSIGFHEPMGFELRRGNDVLVVVAPARGGKWYFYSLVPHLPGKNTSDEPVVSADLAKAEAMAWLRVNGVFP